MKCQRCEAAEACFSMTQVFNGKSVELHLCERCYRIFQSQIENNEKSKRLEKHISTQRKSKDYIQKKYKKSPKQILEELEKELKECQEKREFKKAKIIKEIIENIETEVATIEREEWKAFYIGILSKGGTLNGI